MIIKIKPVTDWWTFLSHKPADRICDLRTRCLRSLKKLEAHQGGGKVGGLSVVEEWIPRAKPNLVLQTKKQLFLLSNLNTAQHDLVLSIKMHTWCTIFGPHHNLIGWLQSSLVARSRARGQDWDTTHNIQIVTPPTAYAEHINIVLISGWIQPLISIYR